MNSRRAGAALVLAGAIVLLVAGTQGSILDGGGDRDELTDDVVATPHPGPNGDYAYLDDETGEIVIDISPANPSLEAGINPETVMRIDDVFELAYTGEDVAEVWLDHDSEHGSFYTRAGSIEGRSHAVTLRENQSIAVGLAVDTRDLGAIDPRIETVEFNARTPERDRGSGPSVQVTSPTNETRSVSISGDTRDRTVGIGLETLRIGPNSTFERIEVQFAENVDSAFDVYGDGAGGRYDPVEGLSASAGAADIGSFTIEGAPDDDAVDTVTYHLDVERDWLEDVGIDVERVALYRYEDDEGTWTELETEVTDRTDERVRFVGTSDSFSLYALGAEETSVAFGDGAVDPGTMEAESQPADAESVEEKQVAFGPGEFAILLSALTSLLLGLWIGRRRRDRANESNPRANVDETARNRP